VNNRADVDLIITGRGGGSREDLWAFNEEVVARAIYISNIPVISAVGHEPDVSISDYVADVRAATPSNAAEIAVPDQDALRQTLDGFSASMASSLQRQLQNARRHLKMLSDSPALQSPEGYLTQRKKTLELLKNRLVSAQIQQVNRKNQRYIGLTAKLDAMSPLKVLTRGYAMVQQEDGTLIRDIFHVHVSDQVTICVADGRFTATVNEVKEQSI
jgi:exodeoxyribonuclease VII large subunit